MTKFKKFIPATVSSTRKGESRISFNSKSGTISFTKEASIKMGLKEGDTVGFIQSEENEKEWYVYKAHDGFQLRTKDNKQFMTQNTQVCKTILPYTKVQGLTASLLLGEPSKLDGVSIYPIIVSSAKNKVTNYDIS